MTLNKALKAKNRLVGELNRQKEILQRENSRESKSTSTVDRSECLSQITRLTSELTELKARIAVANIEIYARIESMGQKKALITFYQSLDTVDGVVETPQYNSPPLRQIFSAYLTKQMVDDMVRALQNDIENLQDQIDEYNAITKV